MDKQTLLDRIAKKEVQIEKIKKRIAKWSDGLSEQDLEMAKLEFTKANNEKFAEYCKANGYTTSFCNIAELRSANSDLVEAEGTLNKYKNQLNIIVDRESSEKIEALVEFFKQYKQNVIKYIENNIEDLLAYYDVNSKRIDLQNENRREIRNNPDGELAAEYRRLKLEEEELKEKVHPITNKVYNSRFEDKIDRDELNKILDEDIEAKYWNMVEKVSKITGEIIDASNISVAGDGNLNGIIIGKDGKAKLETIGAGGYNHNRILDSGRHGQIFHYRLLINKV